jgi:hypothetical protein
LILDHTIGADLVVALLAIAALACAWVVAYYCLFAQESPGLLELADLMTTIGLAVKLRAWRRAWLSTSNAVDGLALLAAQRARRQAEARALTAALDEEELRRRLTEGERK